MFEELLAAIERHPYGAWVAGGVIGVLVVYIISGIINIFRGKPGDHRTDFMLDQCNKSINVQAILMNFVGASRAKTISVCRFRNGKHYFDSTPIMYVDITEEGVVPNMRKTKKTFHGQYVNDMVVELKSMIESEGPIRLYKKNLDKDNPFCEYMDITKLETLVIRRLKIQKQIIGFVMLGFDYELKQDDCLMQSDTLIDTDTNALMKRKCSYDCNGCQFRNYMLNIKKEIELSKSV